MGGRSGPSSAGYDTYQGIVAE